MVARCYRIASVDIAFISLSQEPVIKAGPLYAFRRGKAIKIACNAIAEQEAKRAVPRVTAAADVGLGAPAAPPNPRASPSRFFLEDKVSIVTIAAIIS